MGRSLTLSIVVHIMHGSYGILAHYHNLPLSCVGVLSDLALVVLQRR